MDFTLSQIPWFNFNESGKEISNLQEILDNRNACAGKKKDVPLCGNSTVNRTKKGFA